MRLSLRHAGLLPLLGLLLLLQPAFAQNPDALNSDPGAGKAKKLLDKAVESMGGFAFLNSEESDCEGRVAQLDRNSSLMGYTFIRSYWHFPDKNRTEYVAKSTKAGFLGILIGELPMMVKGGAFIQLFSGDKGWTMDKSGVSEADVTLVSEFQAAAKRQIHNLLLSRPEDDGTYVGYGGTGIADLKQVDWVEFNEREGRTIRLALDRETHLPMRTVVSTPNEEMHDRDEDVTIYSNYKELEGVQTPLQVTREHNGRRTHQIFYNACSNNPNLPSDFFTEASLQKRFKDTGGKAPPPK